MERVDVPDLGKANELADLFKLFGDGTRIKILFSLYSAEKSVGAIGEALGMSPSAVSHQLSVLKQANLVGCRRDGKVVYYFLSDGHVRSIIGQGYEHITEEI